MLPRAQRFIHPFRLRGEIGEPDFLPRGPDGGAALQTNGVRRTAKQRRSATNQLVAQCPGCLLDGLSAQIGDQTGDHSHIRGEHFRGAHRDCHIVG